MKASQRQPSSLRTIPASVPEFNVVSIHQIRQEQLAADILVNIAVLARKLDRYRDMQARLRLDEINRGANDAAIDWMQESFEDLAATLMGLEMVVALPEPGIA